MKKILILTITTWFTVLSFTANSQSSRVYETFKSEKVIENGIYLPQDFLHFNDFRGIPHCISSGTHIYFPFDRIEEVLNEGKNIFDKAFRVFDTVENPTVFKEPKVLKTLYIDNKVGDSIVIIFEIKGDFSNLKNALYIESLIYTKKDQNKDKVFFNQVYKSTIMEVNFTNKDNFYNACKEIEKIISKGKEMYLNKCKLEEEKARSKAEIERALDSMFN